MAHPIYNATFCKTGNKIISTLIKESQTSNCQRQQVADEMNKALGLNPNDWAQVTPEQVKAAVRSGAFDGENESFMDYPGRFGGIRHYMEEVKAEAKTKKSSNSKKSSSNKSNEAETTTTAAAAA